ncbi:MAG TPA: glycosyltransferase family 2 protein, partial [Streptosporangiaceae bacterium]|nr:glycosyltransferase family 2 protein [Streptosporangiaceae bacterium]
MMPWWVLAVFVLGANFALWGSVGLVRLAGSLAARRRRGRSLAGPSLASARPASTVNGGTVMAVTARGDQGALPRSQPSLAASPETALPETGSAVEAPSLLVPSLTTSDVAVLIPAHNEALVIEESLRSIMALVPRGNVHVVSDGSTDATVQIARRAGARVIETQENVGKAGALEEALGRFDLIQRFPVVMLLDADTRVEPGYFTAALPMFDHPQVVAVAGCVRTARDRRMTLGGKVLVGHRTRIYAVGQRALKFGQTWLRSNATPIVPGFASLYRTDVLPQMEMNPPGLVIEDFNMTFEVYQKRLGKVGFTLQAVAVTQDPDNLRDYVRQTKRWAIGLWQTVRRHPPQANLFTAMLTLLLIELITSSLLFFLLPLALIVLAMPDLIAVAVSWPGFGEVHTMVAAHLTLTAVLFGVVLPDYLLTCAVAILERQPRLL